MREDVMGVAKFEFTFDGSIKDFNKHLDDWVYTTSEGRRYKYKDPSPGFDFKVQRGDGMFTVPIIFEFKIDSNDDSTVDILSIGYVRNLIFFGKQAISELAFIGPFGYFLKAPRRDGWKDMMKLLDFLDYWIF